jgi:hypothetical protein
MQIGAHDDLAKIGEEAVPWFCSENYVYVAFQFSAVETHRPGKPYATDVLKSVGEFIVSCL